MQGLMDEIETIDTTEAGWEEKLKEISQRVAIEKQKMKAKAAGVPFNDDAIVDPGDALMCEGCQ